MTVLHYPEMQGEPTALIQARFTGLTGKPYTVTSYNRLPVSRGVEYAGTVDEIGANNCPNKRAGWHKYHMTERAYKALEKTHFILMICLL